jgi:HD-GYP domain-containing protein (c-di-GMP phosphodiesterase class II)
MNDDRRETSDPSAKKIFEVSDQKTIERLIKIGTALSVERELHVLLNMIIEELKFLVSADKASLYLIDKETQELVFHITSDEVLKEMRLPLSRKSIAGYVGLTGDTLRIPDVYLLDEGSPYKFNKDIDHQTGYRTRSMLALPMVDHKGERIGVVQLINKTIGSEAVPFDDEDESLLLALASQAGVSIENARLYRDIEIFFASFVRALASAIEARDPATKGHSRRVALYAEATARAMGTFSDEEIKEILYAAWLHDVGKIGVREHILNKENKLSSEELEIIRERFRTIKAEKERAILEEVLQDVARNPSKAPAITELLNAKRNQLEEDLAEHQKCLAFIEDKNRPGYMDEKAQAQLTTMGDMQYITSAGEKKSFLTSFEIERLRISKGNLTSLERENMNSHVLFTWDILSEIPFTKELKNVPHYASLHHEKLDGSGYPFGYPAEKIPVQARILAVADIYDALVAQDRPYKKPIPQGKALDIIEEMVQSNHLDRNVFTAFIRNRVYELQDKGDEFTFLSKLLNKSGSAVH